MNLTGQIEFFIWDLTNYQWVIRDSTNCYPTENGADDHSCCARSIYTIETFESCQQLCIDTVGCNGITIGDSLDNCVSNDLVGCRRCYLRHNIVLDNCDFFLGWTSAKVTESGNKLLHWDKKIRNLICSIFMSFSPIDFIFIGWIVDMFYFCWILRNFDYKPASEIFLTN